MKIYCGRNRKGMWKASLDEEKLSRFEDVFESEVETIHNNKVYMIRVYRGYEYQGDEIKDVYGYIRKAFHSVSSAKKHKRWRELEELVKRFPDYYYRTSRTIASDDDGVPFTYGSVSIGGFRAEIIVINVI